MESLSNLLNAREELKELNIIGLNATFGHHRSSAIPTFQLYFLMVMRIPVKWLRQGSHESRPKPQGEMIHKK